MATQKQIDANRRNAEKSTGPKTEAGKATAAANALKHGLTATDVVLLPDEDDDAFERLRLGTIADLRPAGMLQHALAARVAVLLWRLERAARMEAELFVHGELALERVEMDRNRARAFASRALADELGEEVAAAQKKSMEAERHNELSSYALAPCARVLAEREESARAFDRLGRHEAALQRALHRTLAEFRTLKRDAAAHARAEAVARRDAPSQPDPAGEEVFPQNEANPAQAGDAAPSLGADPAAPQDPRPSGHRIGEIPLYVSEALFSQSEADPPPASDAAPGGSGTPTAEEDVLQNEANPAQAPDREDDPAPRMIPRETPPIF